MSGLIKVYLVAYNMMCLALWSLAFVTGLKGYSRKGLGGVWGESGSFVLVGQFAMVLEIVHAVLGLVRSPVLTTTIQVFSRLWVVVVPVIGSDCRIGDEKMPGLMVMSWASVEVVRYSFYLSSLLLAKVPYGLFWLRYTVFYVLYPTGITGELGTAMLGQECFEEEKYAWVISVIMAGYLPGSPFMYMNMVKNRKSAMKKRFAPPPKPLRGAAFPAGKDGARSTTSANKATVAAAISASGDASAADSCRREKNYRFGYVRHFKKLVEVSAHSEENALAVARAGVKYMRQNFEFFDGQGEVYAFETAMKQGVTVEGREFETHQITGSGSTPMRLLKLPYDGGWHPSSPNAPSKTVEGDELRALADLWVLRGIIEADAARALTWTADYVAKGGSFKDTYFVLIGAGSAMGPCSSLLELGANVVALDIPGSWGKRAAAVWARLFDWARKSPGGSLVCPVVDKPGPYEERAGCDLVCEPREIADWLCNTWLPTIDAKKARICIGNYTYLDGDLHVKLSLCADYVIERVLQTCRERKVKTSACAFLCTPTDLHLVPDDCALASKTNAETRATRILEKFVNLLTGYLRPNYSFAVGPPDQRSFVCDGLSVAQGPNYALAKRLQHWRANLAFAAGHVVSSNVAPSTATISVIHNKTFAWAYGGMPAFNFEIFKQETTTSIMAALLVHDLLNPQSPKNPNGSSKKLHNPLLLFSKQSVHGGLWRSPYAVDSIGEVSALIYFAQLASQPILAVAIVLVAAHFAYNA